MSSLKSIRSVVLLSPSEFDGLSERVDELDPRDIYFVDDTREITHLELMNDGEQQEILIEIKPNSTITVEDIVESSKKLVEMFPGVKVRVKVSDPSLIPPSILQSASIEKE